MAGQDYVPPTAAEVRALLKALGLTGGQAAALIGLSGDRQVRKYTGGEHPRTLPFAALYALVHRAAGRTVTPSRWREEVRDLIGPAPIHQGSPD